MSFKINRTATPTFALIKAGNPVIHTFDMILFSISRFFLYTVALLIVCVSIHITSKRLIRGHLFSTYAKFSEKLTFLTP